MLTFLSLKCGSGIIISFFWVTITNIPLPENKECWWSVRLKDMLLRICLLITSHYQKIVLVVSGIKGFAFKNLPITNITFPENKVKLKRGGGQ